MKTVEQVSQIYVKNLTDLYIRTIIMKNIIYCINILPNIQSEAAYKLLSSRIKSSLSDEQRLIIAQNVDDIDSILFENVVFVCKRLLKYSNDSFTSSLNVSNCEFYTERNNFSKEKFKNRLNIEKYIVSSDNNVENIDFLNRSYEFKDKMNLEMFRAYFQFFNNDYKKYFSSLKLGVRLNYIINDENFLQKFNLNDLLSETYNKREKNWILFDNSNPQKFIFSMELKKIESFDFINQDYSNTTIHDYVNQGSDIIFEQLISDLIYYTNEDISSYYPIDVNDVLKFVFYDNKYETINNIINENKEFDKLCFEISALITNYKNFRKF